MKRKLLSLLMLLMVAMSAMASDYKLYLEISGTTAMLMCGEGYNGKPYFNFNSGRWEYGGPWNGMESIEKIYVHDTFFYSFLGESLSKLFKGFKNLKTIGNTDALKTSNVTDMSEMFSGCSSLKNLDSYNWNTSNVTNMSHMFDGCSSLESINVYKWNTSKVTDMSYMFSGCESLKPEYLNLNNWNTSKVTDMSDMFSGCTKLCKAVTANEGETGEYWATFYDETDGYNYEAPEGTQVFKVTLSSSGIVMTEIEDRIVKSGEGVVLKSSSDDFTLTPTIAASSTSYDDNDLQGTTTSKTNPNPGNIYVLNKKSAGIGFYKLKENGSIGANKAYLEVGGGNARDFFLFDETTGVSDARGEMEEAGTYFDLQGRRVAHPTKGLYMVHGKKLVIK